MALREHLPFRLRRADMGLAVGNHRLNVGVVPIRQCGRSRQARGLLGGCKGVPVLQRRERVTEQLLQLRVFGLDAYLLKRREVRRDAPHRLQRRDGFFVCRHGLPSQLKRPELNPVF